MQTLILYAVGWIQRHRVRFIDSETALYGLIFFLVIAVFAFLIKWLTRDLRNRY